MNRILLLIGSLGLVTAPAFAEPPDTISTGTVYAYGHELEPPYVLEVVGNTVQLNGVQVYPDLAQVRETREVEPSDWARQTHPISDKVFALKRRLEEAKVPLNEITEKMAAFMREQTDHVDSVRVQDHASFWVYWKDGSNELFGTYSRRKRPTMEERLQSEFELWRRMLTKDLIAIVGIGGGWRHPSMADDVQKEIARARAATPKELENWKSKLFGKKIALQFHQPLSLEEER